MRFKSFIKIVVSAFTVLGLVVSTQAATRGVTDSEIVIGTHTALSGPVAAWGKPIVQAIRMRFEEANEAGGIHGRKIKYVVEDSQYRVPIAVQKANKLINRDKVFALIGSIGTPMNNAVFKFQLPKNVPSLFPYTLARSMGSPHHKLKFTGASSYYDQNRALVKYFVKEKNKKNICLMYQDTDYGMEIVDGVNDQLKAMGMKLTASTSHKPMETNFIGSVTKLRKAKCDLIVLGTIVRDTILSVSAARKMGWMVDMAGTASSCNSIVAARGGKHIEGYYAVSGVEMAYEDQVKGKGKRFFEKFRKKHGVAPGGEAQMAYIIADITVIALENAGRNLTVDSLVKGMESIKSYESMFNGAHRSFGPNKHDASRESVLYKIINGRWLYPSGKRMILTY